MLIRKGSCQEASSALTAQSAPLRSRFGGGTEPRASASGRTESRGHGTSGQALIEFALVLPLLFLLIINVVNFGGMLYAWITVANAARTGAQYLVMGGVSVGAPAQPTATQVQTLVTNDLSALPNRTSAEVCVSASNSATVSCNRGSAPADAPPAAGAAESGITYVVGAVDVTYRYLPFISLWDFSALNIHLTLPPTTLHRQAKMRILQ